jgi:hypothetical protein
MHIDLTSSAQFQDEYKKKYGITLNKKYMPQKSKNYIVNTQNL